MEKKSMYADRKSDKKLNSDKTKGARPKIVPSVSNGKSGKLFSVPSGGSASNVPAAIPVSEKKGKSKLAKATGAKSKPAEGGGEADDLDAWMKSRQLLRPDDQLDLTEAELSEEITRVLSPKNTNVIHNLVVYSFKDGMFIKIPPAGNVVTLLKYDPNCMLAESEEAKRQLEETGEPGIPLPTTDYSLTEHAARVVPGAGVEDGLDEEEEEGEEEGEEEEQKGAGKDLEGEEGEEEGEEEEEDEEGKADEMEEAEAEQEVEEAVDIPTAIPLHSKKKKLINQFNCSERAALTFVYSKRSVETQTIPPPRSQYSNNVLQWTIYDSYAEDYQAQQKDKEKKEDRKVRRDDGKADKDEKAHMASKLNQKYLKCWQILERMINQNIYKEIAHDYRYWEDPADEYREFEGTLLPLWKFQYDRARKMSVTYVMFNPAYYDLFAVCLGSHDFMKQPSEGCLCFFTIKNPAYPDYIIMTECGVMCCDIHSKYPFLVVIGLYDGNVAVYNLKENYKEPLYVSMAKTVKHSECVWKVTWGPEMADGEVNFFSISSSGQIFHWVLMQNQLLVTPIMTLLMEDGLVEGPDDSEVQLNTCGSCMVFHPQNPGIFLVGTEEGNIYKCSTEFSSKYLMKYVAHNLSVYRIDYNRFNSNIFISCSGDWRIKIWEDMRHTPLFIFDLGAAVGDVKWAPYSSTVFVAVTNEGKVWVFDLNVNKYRPICTQAVVRKNKNKLTRLAFNEKLPFIIVGDDKGTVTSLKLSPNLRLMVKPPKKQLYLDQNTLQIQKLEKLLSLVRELPEGEIIADTTTTMKS